MAGNTLRFEQVTKEYRGGPGIGRVRALEGFSAEVPGGAVVGLVGPNGCGKSTALKCALGLLEVDQGRVRFGQHAAGAIEAARAMGYLPESGGVPAYLSGREALGWWARMCDCSEESIDAALAEVGLEEAGDRRVSAYSKGMRQRLALAQAILPNPSILLLDEPFSGVDPLGVDRMVAILRRRSDAGNTILLTSHLLPRIEAVCDHIILLARGRVLAEGAPADLLGETGPRPRGLDDVFRELLGGTNGS